MEICIIFMNEINIYFNSRSMIMFSLKNIHSLCPSTKAYCNQLKKKYVGLMYVVVIL